MVIDVFISTSGRSGGKKNPDVIVALICCTFTFLTTSFLTPLVILFKKCKNFLVILFATYVITRFYFIAFTHYGFPYKDDKNGDPRVQRHYITVNIIWFNNTVIQNWRKQVCTRKEKTWLIQLQSQTIINICGYDCVKRVLSIGAQN